MKTILTLFLLTLLTNAAEVDVYLLGGQSNMQGIGKTKNIPSDIIKPLPNIQFFNRKSFEPLIIGKTKTSNRAGEFGPEITFATNIHSQTPTYIIKYAASGMPLHPGWNGNKWIGGQPDKPRTNFFPGINPKDPGQGKLYTQMLNRFQAGINEIKKQGHTPIIKGFAWMQGEQDSKNVTSATHYATSLKILHKRLTEDLGLTELPMAYGQVLPHEPALDRFNHRKELRAQMAAADTASGKPEAIPLAKMISTDGFPLLPDTVHYNAQGQILLGSAMAKAIKSLQTPTKTPTQNTKLWPNLVPGFPADYKHKPHTQLDPDRISETSQPYLTTFPAQGKPTGQAIVIFPGGGYHILSEKKEGNQVATHFAKQGITCFVCNYRVTRSNNNPNYQFPGPLLDARQAIRLAKLSAKKYNFDPNKLGVMGFSAGGHLASMCATRFDETFENEIHTEISPRPAFAALIYPVTSMVSSASHQGSRTALFGNKQKITDLQAASPELAIKPNYPPLFIAQNQFDFVNSNDTLTLAQAATKNKVPCETHIFPGRDHGFGLGRPNSKAPEKTWPALLTAYLKRL